MFDIGKDLQDAYNDGYAQGRHDKWKAIGDMEKIANYYKLDSQLDKLIEESAEVIQAIQKYKQGERYITRLIEELADLSIVYEQVIYLLRCDEKMAVMRDYKVDRQLRRIKGERLDVRLRKGWSNEGN